MRWVIPRSSRANVAIGSKVSVWMAMGALALIFSPGCAPIESAGRPVDQGQVGLSELLQARATAHTFDRAMAALAHGDGRQLRARAEALREAIGPLEERRALLLSFAATATVNAMREDEAARLSTGPLATGVVEARRRRANANYRAALEILPAEPLEMGSMLLNALGYFLADRGQDAADFERAVELTAMALEVGDQEMIDLPPETPRGRRARLALAIGAGDSHAWALFRAGRLEEARDQQQQVLEQVALFSGPEGEIPGELLFHMAEILRALGELEEAREFYERALLLGDLDASTQQAAQAALNELER